MAHSVAGIGGANVDIHGRSEAPLLLRDSNPGVLHTSLGGVCRNICDNLCRMGESVQFLGAVGDDLYGKLLLDGCTALGMDMSRTLVCKGRRSSTYISVMDDSGDMLVGMSDMSILGEMGIEFVEHVLPMLNSARLCVTDTNLPAETLAELGRRSTVPLFIDPVSCTKGKKLIGITGLFHTIKPNLMEMETLAEQRIDSPAALERACDKILATGTQQLFVSMGAQGLYYKNAQGLCLHQKSKPFAMKNATGAGDATMAGIIYGFLHELSPADTLRFALGAGLATIDSPDTINSAISPSLVERYSKEYAL